MMARALTVTVLTGILVTGCGASSAQDENEPRVIRPARGEPECVKPSRAAVTNLQKGLKVPGRLRDAQAVESTDAETTEGFGNFGLFYLAATLGDRVLIWGVGGDFIKDGGGLAIGIDANTRRASRAGDLADPAAVGLSMGAGDVTAALMCARRP